MTYDTLPTTLVARLKLPPSISRTIWCNLDMKCVVEKKLNYVEERVRQCAKEFDIQLSEGCPRDTTPEPHLSFARTAGDLSLCLHNSLNKKCAWNTTIFCYLTPLQQRPEATKLNSKLITNGGGAFGLLDRIDNLKTGKYGLVHMETMIELFHNWSLLKTIANAKFGGIIWSYTRLSESAHTLSLGLLMDKSNLGVVINYNFTWLLTNEGNMCCSLCRKMESFPHPDPFKSGMFQDFMSFEEMQDDFEECVKKFGMKAEHCAGLNFDFSVFLAVEGELAKQEEGPNMLQELF